MSAVIQDNLFTDEQLEMVRAYWPDSNWPGWVKYDPSVQCKHASDVEQKIPAAIAGFLAQIARLPVEAWFPDMGPLVPDLGLWGAGIHQMPAGPGLQNHLDADTHGRLGIERMLSSVLWVHDEWLKEWGGELVLGSGAIIEPRPGRIAIFDCRNEWHCVKPVKCPADKARLSLAMFWYSPRRGGGTRMQAHFTKGSHVH